MASMSLPMFSSALNGRRALAGGGGLDDARVLVALSLQRLELDLELALRGVDAQDLVDVERDALVANRTAHDLGLLTDHLDVQHARIIPIK
jgi:hypothetical protein